MQLSRIGVLSCGKVLGALYALLGLIIGGFVTMLSLLMGAAMGGNQQQGFGSMLFGAAAIIMLPIFYGVLGFIGGILSAALYNVVASAIGGIELEFAGYDRPPGEYSTP